MTPIGLALAAIDLTVIVSTHGVEGCVQVCADPRKACAEDLRQYVLSDLEVHVIWPILPTVTFPPRQV